MKKILWSTSLLVVALISVVSKSINAQEIEDEREFDYAATGEKGPQKWGEMKEEWAACKMGKMQSPIDLSNERVGLVSRSERSYYKPSNASVKNRGHDIQIQWSGNGGLVSINRTGYALRYAHWHSPSEHTINGRRYHMELHLVHLTSDHRIAVVGVLYKLGKPDPFLAKLMVNISSMMDKKGEEVSLGKIDPNGIDMRSRRYYRYVGSLTVPPCTEGVVWTINRKVKTVSREQVRLLREAVHDYAEANARPLQPNNRRSVYLYGPGVSN